ncbi:hypothetical protein LY54_00089 [Salegentibacter mishustinae]|uniref:Uncharacterized protein n=1 Tax=Salegentibacter mishustinae TaxID=270918 RepID=A0A0Q9Z9N8_9FLAO|nr:hypothetical protein APR42_16015 [Salegentibacter mishustinae]PNW22147.1 hypothetical protein APB85_13100 [Salegentibacter mishustinae]PZX67359.1 hypothetical protein LY54_00089 [Salegentibacter mishustinae]
MKLIKNNIKSSLIFSLALYLLDNLFIVGQEKYYEQQLINYDLNETAFLKKMKEQKSNRSYRKKSPVIQLEI